jgi:hypothetical protein
MKIFILSFFLTVAAQAEINLKILYPVLGDRVFFEGAYRQMPYTVERKLVAQHTPGFQFREVFVSNVYFDHCPGGCGARSDKYIDQFTLPTHQKYKAAMETCIKDGGVFEMVKVPAGVYDSCKLKGVRKYETGYSFDYRWVADVPWGAAKYITEDYSLDGRLLHTVTLDLKEVTFGIPQ